MEIPGYRILQEFQRNKNRSTCLASRHEDSQQVILKYLNPPIVDLEKHALRREGKHLQELNSSRFPKLLDIIETETTPVLVLEYLVGESLNSHLINSSPLSTMEFLNLSIELCRSLHELHHANILHGDLKPSNIIIQDDGKVTAIDFGSSQTFSHILHQNNVNDVIERSFFYMSPEQTGRTNRALDNRTDIYSSGIIFYEMLTGNPPFHNQDALALIHSHLSLTPKAPSQIKSGIPEVLDSIILKMLSKDPEQRYQSISGLMADLIEAKAQWLQTGDITPFPIGKKDHKLHIQIPQKSYGRSTEKERLRPIFQQTHIDHQQVVLVSGTSGIGKSSFVRDLCTETNKRRGLFCEGKFEENSPEAFLGIRKAMGDLLQQLLFENHTAQNIHGKWIQDHLADNMWVLQRELPDIFEFYAEEKESLQLPTQEYENLRLLSYAKLTHILRDANRPLILFLDDLQWADIASLNFIEHLLKDSDLHHITLILAFRDLSQYPDSPFRGLHQQIKEEYDYHDVPLGPLTNLDLYQFTFDAIPHTQCNLQNLVNILYKQSGGNPYYYKELLNNLLNQNKIFLGADHAWEWNQNELTKWDIGANHTDLILYNFRSLSEPSQNLLIWASKLGHIFSSEELSKFLDSSIEDMAQLFEEILKVGMVAYADHHLFNTEHPCYQFAHDSIRETIAHLEHAQSESIDLKIGRYFLTIDTPSPRDIIQSCHYLNPLFDKLDESEKKELFSHNVKAGLALKEKTSYLQALDFFNHAIDQHTQLNLELDNTYWSLGREEFECQYLCGHFEQARESFENLLQKSKTSLQKAELYNLYIILLNNQGQHAQVLEQGIRGLSELGFSLKTECQQTDVVPRLLYCIAKQVGKPSERLLEIKATPHPENDTKFQIISNMIPSSYFVSPNTFSVLVLEMVKMTLQMGSSAYSSYPIALYGMVMGPAMGFYKKGDQYGQTAIDMSEAFEITAMRARCHMIKGTFLQHWVQPYESCHDDLHQGHRIALSCGEMIMAGYCLNCRHYLMIAESEPVNEIRQWCLHSLEYFKKSKDYTVSINLELTIQYLDALQTPTLHLLDRRQELRQLETKLPLHLHLIHSIKIAYFKNDVKLGLELAKELSPLSEVALGLPQLADQACFLALTYIEAYRKVPERTYMNAAQAQLKNLKKYHKHCPSNQEHRYFWVMAEIERHKKHQKLSAIPKYERALNHALINKRWDFVAMISRAMILYLRSQEADSLVNSRAIVLQSAIHSWEATGLQNHWSQVLGSLKYFEHKDQAQKSPKKPLLSSTSTHREDIQFDSQTFLKINQALTGQFEFKELLQNIMTLAIQFAGSHQACLVLKHKERWVVAADVDKKLYIPELESAEPLENYREVSHLAIQHCLKEQNHLSMRDSNRGRDPIKDYYLTQYNVKSYLCIPILLQDTTLGAFYFENRITAQVFSPNQIEILKILATQVSTSIEHHQSILQQRNVTDTQRQMTEAYARFVPRQMFNTLNKVNIVDLELGDHIEKVMTVLYVNIPNYSQSVSPTDNLKAINSYLKQARPIIHHHDGFICKYLDDAMIALFPEHTKKGLNTALDLIQELYDNDHEHKSAIHIGIHSGPTLYGIIGETSRMEGTVISGALEVAGHFEQEAQALGAQIIIEESMLEHCQKLHCSYRYLGTSTLDNQKGHKLYEVYEAHSQEQKELKLKTQDLFSKAIEYTETGNLIEASACFQQVLEANPNDVTARNLMNRLAEQ